MVKLFESWGATMGRTYRARFSACGDADQPTVGTQVEVEAAGDPVGSLQAVRLQDPDGAAFAPRPLHRLLPGQADVVADPGDGPGLHVGLPGCGGGVVDECADDRGRLWLLGTGPDGVVAGHGR